MAEVAGDSERERKLVTMTGAKLTWFYRCADPPTGCKRFFTEEELDEKTNREYKTSGRCPKCQFTQRSIRKE